MKVDHKIRNRLKQVPDPSKPRPVRGSRAPSPTMPATLEPEWRPVRRLVSRAFMVTEPMEIPSDSHGLQAVEVGDVVMQDENGQLHSMEAERFSASYVFADEGPPFGLGDDRPAYAGKDSGVTPEMISKLRDEVVGLAARVQTLNGIAAAVEGLGATVTSLGAKVETLAQTVGNLPSGKQTK